MSWMTASSVGSVLSAGAALPTNIDSFHTAPSFLMEGEKDLHIDPRSVAWELSPSVALQVIEPARAKPYQASVQLESTGWPAPLTGSVFNKNLLFLPQQWP